MCVLVCGACMGGVGGLSRITGLRGSGSRVRGPGVQPSPGRRALMIWSNVVEGCKGCGLL